jgi:hypothetical protein
MPFKNAGVKSRRATWADEPGKNFGHLTVLQRRRP